MLSIGKLSKRTGVKVPTIRYYENIGLMPTPERSRSNQRLYSNEGLKRLSFIRHSRELGFPIEHVRELLQLSEHPDQPCKDAHDIALQHLDDVRDRLRRLERLEKELKRIASCDAESVADCAVIETLADHEVCVTEH